ncbi:ABC transporter substrate-binding protein [Bradyrhizobium sp. SSBR45G]|uniref:ABC transporter substrate-binding protein n=1 Tax=unclassified Bradyrhizobium TaxID=2631580 RepID=UPI002342A988|nr:MULTISPECIES: ABC transporter substrate-binding protein [unclassified Bradyrhizobium]GLH77116.1 ABC transporter substrate-binding protein [Bradyrhizobium sp. SSBR45G]GLH83874.1 ABC transporter substrate-binding protein [Bradyrhizobium sp. SSBR45R]
MTRHTQGPDVGSQPLPDQSKRGFMKVAAAAGAMAALGRNSLAWAANKDTIRIGYISPKTGPFSPFAEADDFILAQVRKSLSDGLTIGGRTYAVEILARDDQSNPDRQSNLAAELINKDNVDLMLAQVAIGPNASQQCELNGVPCISTVGPWQAWLFPLKGDPSKGFKNVFHFFWGLEDIVAVYQDIWKDVPTNKVVGSLFTNDVPGNSMGDAKMGMPAAFAAAGYKIVDIGRFPVGADDFSTFIQAFKKENVEIVTGLFNPPEWASFVKQSAQMGFKPKVATIAKALLFPGAVEALGPSANGMSTEIWWTPAYPFKSSLTGLTARQLADSYEAATKRTWTQPIGVVHALFEAGIQALKDSGNPKDPTKVADATRAMKLDTIIGRLDFTASGIKNVSKIRIVGGQWRVENGKTDIYITNNATAPEIPVQRKFEIL